MSGVTATRPEDGKAGATRISPVRRRRPERRFWIAGFVTLFALLLPPAPTAALLVGAASTSLGDVTAGVWIFKAALLLNVAGLLLLTHALRAPASGSALLVWPAAANEAKLPVAVLLMLLTLSLALRLPQLGAGLWHDEIATLVEYGRRPLGEILATYPSQNQHPLYSLLARSSVAIFGLNAWALRLPAVLLGTASLAALYAFGAQVGRRREAVLATLLLAVSYHHVWFSQNARGYTGLMLLTVLGSGLFLQLLSGRVRSRGAVILGYAVCMALAVWTHLTAAFVVAAHFVVWAILALRRRRDAPGWTLAPLFAMVLAGTFALQLYALMLPQFGETLFAPKAEFGATPWRSPLWLIAETMRGAARGLPGGWAGLVAGTAVATAGMLSFARRSSALAAVLLLPAVLTAGALVALDHNLWPRFFFFAAGFAVLIAVRGVFAMLEWAWPRGGLRAATVLLVLAAAASAWTLRSAWGPKQDYEGALARVAEERAPGDPVVTAGLASFALQAYLQADVRAVESEPELRAAESTGARAWLIYSFPTHLAAAEPEVWARIQSEYRTVAEFPGTLAGGTVYLLSRP